jgi:hypothetical protein
MQGGAANTLAPKWFQLFAPVGKLRVGSAGYALSLEPLRDDLLRDLERVADPPGHLLQRVVSQFRQVQTVCPGSRGRALLFPKEWSPRDEEQAGQLVRLPFHPTVGRRLYRLDRGLPIIQVVELKSLDLWPV